MPESSTQKRPFDQSVSDDISLSTKKARTTGQSTELGPSANMIATADHHAMICERTPDDRIEFRLIELQSLIHDSPFQLTDFVQAMHILNELGARVTQSTIKKLGEPPALAIATYNRLLQKTADHLANFIQADFQQTVAALNEGLAGLAIIIAYHDAAEIIEQPLAAQTADQPKIKALYHHKILQVVVDAACQALSLSETLPPSPLSASAVNELINCFFENLALLGAHQRLESTAVTFNFLLKQLITLLSQQNKIQPNTITQTIRLFGNMKDEPIEINGLGLFAVMHTMAANPAMLINLQEFLKIVAQLTTTPEWTRKSSYLNQLANQTWTIDMAQVEEFFDNLHESMLKPVDHQVEAIEAAQLWCMFFQCLTMFIDWSKANRFVGHMRLPPFFKIVQYLLELLAPNKYLMSSYPAEVISHFLATMTEHQYLNEMIHSGNLNYLPKTMVITDDNPHHDLVWSHLTTIVEHHNLGYGKPFIGWLLVLTPNPPFDFLITLALRGFLREKFSPSDIITSFQHYLIDPPMAGDAERRNANKTKVVELLMALAEHQLFPSVTEVIQADQNIRQQWHTCMQAVATWMRMTSQKSTWKTYWPRCLPLIDWLTDYFARLETILAIEDPYQAALAQAHDALPADTDGFADHIELFLSEDRATQEIIEVNFLALVRWLTRMKKAEVTVEVNAKDQPNWLGMILEQMAKKIPKKTQRNQFLTTVMAKKKFNIWIDEAKQDNKDNQAALLAKLLPFFNSIVPRLPRQLILRLLVSSYPDWIDQLINHDQLSASEEDQPVLLRWWISQYTLGRPGFDGATFNCIQAKLWQLIKNHLLTKKFTDFPPEWVPILWDSIGRTDFFAQLAQSPIPMIEIWRKIVTIFGRHFDDKHNDPAIVLKAGLQFAFDLPEEMPADLKKQLEALELKNINNCTTWYNMLQEIFDELYRLTKAAQTVASVAPTSAISGISANSDVVENNYQPPNQPMIDAHFASSSQQLVSNTTARYGLELFQYLKKMSRSTPLEWPLILRQGPVLSDWYLSLQIPSHLQTAQPDVIAHLNWILTELTNWVKATKDNQPFWPSVCHTATYHRLVEKLIIGDGDLPLAENLAPFCHGLRSLQAIIENSAVELVDYPLAHPAGNSPSTIQASHCQPLFNVLAAKAQVLSSESADPAQINQFLAESLLNLNFLLSKKQLELNPIIVKSWLTNLLSLLAEPKSEVRVVKTVVDIFVNLKQFLADYIIENSTLLNILSIMSHRQHVSWLVAIKLLNCLLDSTGQLKTQGIIDAIAGQLLLTKLIDRLPDVATQTPDEQVGYWFLVFQILHVFIHWTKQKQLQGQLQLLPIWPLLIQLAAQAKNIQHLADPLSPSCRRLNLSDKIANQIINFLIALFEGNYLYQVIDSQYFSALLAEFPSSFYQFSGYPEPERHRLEWLVKYRCLASVHFIDDLSDQPIRVVLLNSAVKHGVEHQPRSLQSIISYKRKTCSGRELDKFLDLCFTYAERQLLSEQINPADSAEMIDNAIVIIRDFTSSHDDDTKYWPSLNKHWPQIEPFLSWFRNCLLSQKIKINQAIIDSLVLLDKIEKRLSNPEALAKIIKRKFNVFLENPATDIEELHQSFASMLLWFGRLRNGQAFLHYRAKVESYPDYWLANLTRILYNTLDDLFTDNKKKRGSYTNNTDKIWSDLQEFLPVDPKLQQHTLYILLSLHPPWISQMTDESAGFIQADKQCLILWWMTLYHQNQPGFTRADYVNLHAQAQLIIFQQLQQPNQGFLIALVPLLWELVGNHDFIIALANIDVETKTLWLTILKIFNRYPGQAPDDPSAALTAGLDFYWQRNQVDRLPQPLLILLKELTPAVKDWQSWQQVLTRMIEEFAQLTPAVPLPPPLHLSTSNQPLPRDPTNQIRAYALKNNL